MASVLRKKKRCRLCVILFIEKREKTVLVSTTFDARKFPRAGEKGECIDMMIFIGADHAGYELKRLLIPFLEELGHEVIDKGAFGYDGDDDYPDFIFPVAKEVSARAGTKGIVIGASGQGEAIAANRFHGIRAAVYYGPPQQSTEESPRSESDRIIKLSREHNDANILSLGARFLSEWEAKKAVKNWLETDFSGEMRHLRRIKKLDDENIYLS